MYILGNLLKSASQSLMSNTTSINRTIRPFNKTVTIEGDKSLSIRWALLASQATGKSSAINILKSEDVLNTLKLSNILTYLSHYSFHNRYLLPSSIHPLSNTAKAGLKACIK